MTKKRVDEDLLRVELRDVNSLVPYPRNAKRHDIPTLRRLVEQGYTNPVLADGDNILAGHGRVETVKLIYADGGVVKLPDGRQLPKGTIPVINCSGWSEEQKRAYILADNQSTIAGGMDREMVALELIDLKAVGFDLTLTAFALPEIEAMTLGWVSDIDPKANDGAHTDGITATVHVDLAQADAEKARNLITAAMADAGIKCTLR